MNSNAYVVFLIVVCLAVAGVSLTVGKVFNSDPDSKLIENAVQERCVVLQRDSSGNVYIYWVVDKSTLSFSTRQRTTFKDSDGNFVVLYPKCTVIYPPGNSMDGIWGIINRYVRNEKRKEKPGKVVN